MLIALIVGGGSLYIFEYNALVSARYEVGETKETIIKEGLAQADIQHVLFQATDLKKLEEVAKEHFLILDERPTYLHIGKKEENSTPALVAN